jgi:hypothetical protein
LKCFTDIIRVNKSSRGWNCRAHGEMIIVYSKSEYLKGGDKSVYLNVGGIIILNEF